MGVNRFETVRPQEYQSTYVPLPFEQMVKAGGLHQQRIDDNQGQLDAISALLSNVKSLDRVKTGDGSDRYVGDRDYLVNYKQGINKEIEDIAAGYTDKGDVNYRQKINGLARRVVGDLAPEGKVGKIHTAATMYEQQDKAMQDAEKFSQAPWLGKQIWDTREQYAEDNGGGYQGNAQLSVGNIGKFVDRNKEMDGLVEGIKPILSKLWADTNGVYIKNGKVTEVGRNKILNTVNGFLPNSEAYKDMAAERDFQTSIGNPNADSDFSANVTSLTEGLISKYLESNGDADMKADPYGLEDYKKKLEETMPRFETQGIGLNPQTVEKTAGDLDKNINTLKAGNQALQQEKAGLAPGSPEWNRADAQELWNSTQIKMREEMREKADSAVNGATSATDKALFKRFGHFDPTNYSDPKLAEVVNEMVEKKIIPNQSSADLGLVMAYLGSKDPRQDAKALSGAYNRKQKSIDKYLENESSNYTLQPTLITVDNTKDEKTSKAIEDLYNNGMGSWQVFDENGPIADPAKIPPQLKINQISKAPVGDMGFLFGASADYKDEKGNVTAHKRYYVRPAGEHNINEKVGLDLMKENKPLGQDKEGNMQFETSQSESRYKAGAEMIYPELASQVSGVRTGHSKDIVVGNQVVASVKKEKTASGVKYVLTKEGFNSKTVGSYEEVLDILNQMK